MGKERTIMATQDLSQPQQDLSYQDLSQPRQDIPQDLSYQYLLQPQQQDLSYQDLSQDQEAVPPVKNRGTGAGGANTNLYGKTFEQQCDLESSLLAMGFERRVMNKSMKYGYYLYRDDGATYMKQSGLREYARSKYNIERLHLFPDECFIIPKSNGTRPTLVVLEMKHQRVEGSCFDKIKCAPFYQYQYKELFGHLFDIEYHLVVNDFIQTKIKNNPLLEKYLALHGVKYFPAENDDYLCTMFTYLGLQKST